MGNRSLTHTLGVALQIIERWYTRLNLWYDLSLWFLLRRTKWLQVTLLIAEWAGKMCVVYTTRLSVPQTVERWAIRWTVNGTLERVWKEAVPVWLRLPRGTEENHKNHHSAGRDSNQTSLGANFSINPYPTAFPYGNGMVLHFYQQQESSTTKTVHKVINKRLKTYVYSLHTGENFH